MPLLQIGSNNGTMVVVCSHTDFQIVLQGIQIWVYTRFSPGFELNLLTLKISSLQQYSAFFLLSCFLYFTFCLWTWPWGFRGPLSSGSKGKMPVSGMAPRRLIHKEKLASETPKQRRAKQTGVCQISLCYWLSDLRGTLSHFLSFSYMENLGLGLNVRSSFVLTLSHRVEEERDEQKSLCGQIFNSERMLIFQSQWVCQLWFLRLQSQNSR